MRKELRIKNYFFIFLVVILFIPVIVFATENDRDNDGLSDYLEDKVYYTNSSNPDTDGDGILDGEEVEKNLSPRSKGKYMYEVDTDKDRLNDFLEVKFGSHIAVADTDGDGYDDFTEVMYGYSPTDPEPIRRYDRKLVVDRTKQRMYYKVNNFTILNIPVSTGNPGTPTPKGEFEIGRMIPNMRYVGIDYDLPNVLWNMEFAPGGYFIHGAYWHNDFGKKTHSHGCINLSENHAGFLYKYMQPGVKVIVIGETPSDRVVK